MVIVNLRPETEEETEFVSFDRRRVLKVRNRMAADLDDFSQRSAEEMKGSMWSEEGLDSQARHRRQLAEPPPKGPSQRDQRAALRVKLGLPPK